ASTSKARVEYTAPFSAIQIEKASASLERVSLFNSSGCPGTCIQKMCFPWIHQKQTLGILPGGRSEDRAVGAVLTQHARM
ncbi:hypothetical protein LEMLEM_LOCUS3324, partial [Lemmus lemmus]